MRSILFKISFAALLANLVMASQAFAADGARQTVTYALPGISSLWILANFSYAGMRAQGHRGSGWRIVSFIFGFPGTLLSLIFVDRNSERVYGVDLPRRKY